MHSVAVSERGELWTWGVNDEGQLGRPIPRDDDEAPAVPGKVEVRGDLVGRAIAKGAPAPRVVAAAATDAATFALLAGGVVVGCGVFKDDAELGFSPLNRGRQHGLARVAGPLLLPETDDEPAAGKKRKRDAARAPHASWPVASIAAGNAHVVMLAEDPAPRRSAAAPAASSSPRARARKASSGASAPASPPRLAASPRCSRPRPFGCPAAPGAPSPSSPGGGTRSRSRTRTSSSGGASTTGASSAWTWTRREAPAGTGARSSPGSSPRSPSAASRNSRAASTTPSRGRVRAGADVRALRVRAPRARAAERVRAGDGRRRGVGARAGRLPPGRPAADVAAGMKESASTDAEGRAWMWGSGSGNMQGRGDDEEDVMRPELVPEKEAYAHWRPKEQRIAAVSIGAQHVMAIATPGHAGEWAAAA